MYLFHVFILTHDKSIKLGLGIGTSIPKIKLFRLGERGDMIWTSLVIAELVGASFTCAQKKVSLHSGHVDLLLDVNHLYRQAEWNFFLQVRQAFLGRE